MIGRNKRLKNSMEGLKDKVEKISEYRTKSWKTENAKQ